MKLLLTNYFIQTYYNLNLEFHDNYVFAISLHRNPGNENTIGTIRKSLRRHFPTTNRMHTDRNDPTVIRSYPKKEARIVNFELPLRNGFGSLADLHLDDMTLERCTNNGSIMETEQDYYSNCYWKGQNLRLIGCNDSQARPELYFKLLNGFYYWYVIFLTNLGANSLLFLLL